MSDDDENERWRARRWLLRDRITHARRELGSAYWCDDHRETETRIAEAIEILETPA